MKFLMPSAATLCLALFVHGPPPASGLDEARKTEPRDGVAALTGAGPETSHKQPSQEGVTGLPGVQRVVSSRVVGAAATQNQIHPAKPATTRKEHNSCSAPSPSSSSSSGSSGL